MCDTESLTLLSKGSTYFIGLVSFNHFVPPKKHTLFWGNSNRQGIHSCPDCYIILRFRHHTLTTLITEVDGDVTLIHIYVCEDHFAEFWLYRTHLYKQWKSTSVRPVWSSFHNYSMCFYVGCWERGHSHKLSRQMGSLNNLWFCTSTNYFRVVLKTNAQGWCCGILG